MHWLLGAHLTTLARPFAEVLELAKGTVLASSVKRVGLTPSAITEFTDSGDKTSSLAAVLHLRLLFSKIAVTRGESAYLHAWSWCEEDLCDVQMTAGRVGCQGSIDGRPSAVIIWRQSDQPPVSGCQKVLGKDPVLT